MDAWPATSAGETAWPLPPTSLQVQTSAGRCGSTSTPRTGASARYGPCRHLRVRRGDAKARRVLDMRPGHPTFPATASARPPSTEPASRPPPLAAVSDSPVKVVIDCATGRVTTWSVPAPRLMLVSVPAAWVVSCHSVRSAPGRPAARSNGRAAAVDSRVATIDASAIAPYPFQGSCGVSRPSPASAR